MSPHSSKKRRAGANKNKAQSGSMMLMDKMEVWWDWIDEAMSLTGSQNPRDVARKARLDAELLSEPFIIINTEDRLRYLFNINYGGGHGVLQSDAILHARLVDLISDYGKVFHVGLSTKIRAGGSETVDDDDDDDELESETEDEDDDDDGEEEENETEDGKGEGEREDEDDDEEGEYEDDDQYYDDQESDDGFGG